MKTMIIRSETPQEDVQAAGIINNQMMQRDCGRIVWYSNLGKTLARIDAHEEIIQRQVRTLDNLIDKANRASKNDSDFKFQMIELENELKDIKEKLMSRVVALEKKEVKDGRSKPTKSA